MSDLTRWNPFTELQNLQRQIFGDDWAAPVRGTNAPTTDIFTREGELVIEAHLPNVAKENISVDVEDNALVISASTRERTEESDRTYVVREAASSFRRSVRLPDGADVDNITADLTGGVLTVTVPTPDAKTTKRTIDIGGEG